MSDKKSTVFTYNGRKIKIVPISNEIALESNRYYAKAFDTAERGGSPLRPEVEEMLKRRGLHDTTTNDAKIREARKDLRILELQLRKGVIDNRRMTKAEGKALALKMRKEREKLSTIGRDLSSYFSNTAESYAENQRLRYYIYATAVDADTGANIWKSFESFDTETDSALMDEVSRHFLVAISGIDEDYEKEFYEVKWLIRMGFMNQKLRLIDEKGRLVDDEGRLIDENDNYIDELGNRVDIYGNRLDKDGNLAEEDVWGLSASTSESDLPPKTGTLAANVSPTNP